MDLVTWLTERVAENSIPYSYKAYNHCQMKGSYIRELRLDRSHDPPNVQEKQCDVKGLGS